MSRRGPMRGLGLMVCSVGVGILLAVLIPIWGWLILGGCSIIGVGWYIMNRFC